MQMATLNMTTEFNQEPHQEQILGANLDSNITPNLETWIQLNLGLDRQNYSVGQSAQAFFEKVMPQVQRWREDGTIDSCYFMRKPPDIRFRLRIVNTQKDSQKNSRQAAMSTLSQQMQQLQNQGYLTSFFFSDYVPESHLFGGPQSMSAVHQHFDADTSLWLKRLVTGTTTSAISSEQLLMAVFDHLFCSAFEDELERYRVWATLGALIPDPQITNTDNIEATTTSCLLTSGMTALKEIARKNGLERDTEILHQYQQANYRLVSTLHTLARKQHLHCDLFQSLATVAMFNFNRHGFSGQRSGPLVHAHIRTLKSRMTQHYERAASATKSK